MLRVGYPAKIDPAPLRAFGAEVELIPLAEPIDGELELDVWIPDPNIARSKRIATHLRGLRLVLSLMAGTEWIPEAVGPHVTICNARGAHNVSTAEWAVSAAFAMLKYFPLYLGIQAAGNWRRRKEATALYEHFHTGTRSPYPPVMVEELTGKRVLLVGYGEIGKEIERMLVPFHVELQRVARTARPASETAPEVHAVSELDNLLPEAEVIILILPLTEESHGLIGARQFGLMRQGALLVNAARGPIVATDALVDALNSGKIRAALDVTDPEPLPEGHPLWRCPNLLITPHVAGSTPQFSVRGLQTVAAELQRYIEGKPLENVVQAAV
jgi:phosphoglycerate dehydrogenase-like enzyme